MPVAILSISGIVVSPDLRISSCVMTHTAAAESDSFSACRETDVISMLIRASRGMSARPLSPFSASSEVCARPKGDARSRINRASNSVANCDIDRELTVELRYQGKCIAISFINE